MRDHDDHLGADPPPRVHCGETAIAILPLEKSAPAQIL